jgi:GT2 family glycosyltransferase
VVAVMVAHDPGPWWEDALASLATQTYRELTVLVLAPPMSAAQVPGGDWSFPERPGDDIEQRLARVLPRAVLRRLDANVGFGPACNEVITSVQGAAFFLFLHDDVALDADAVELLVEEAVRSNAGIVGAKVVDWHQPRNLLSVGMGADKFGAPASSVEPGELDQEQHDAVRDCFYVPGGATLVRADLFASLGGFDPGIDLVGEDLDLGWRAHLAGARVLVVPRARIAHREALEERPAVVDRRRRAREHQLRTVLICYGRLHRWRVLPQLLLITVIEALASLLVGHVDHATDAVSAWPRALRRHGSIRRARKALKAVRVVSDAEIRTMQVRGSAGANRFVRGQLESDGRGTVAGAVTRLGARARSRSARPTIAVLGAVILIGLFGTRDLLTGTIPAIGQFVPFERGPAELLQSWASGFAPNGLGGLGSNPTGLGFLGFAGFVVLGAMDQLRKLLILGLLPVGAYGIWRLARPVGSTRARLVALVVYVALPLPVNALAAGRWGSLVVWSLTPWIVYQLARASGLEPFALRDREPQTPGRVLLYRGVATGVLTALAAMVEPFALVSTLVIALALAFGGVLAGQSAAAGRIARVGLVGAGVGFVLHVPWSFALLAGGWSDTSGTAATAELPLSAGQVLRFATGPVADSPLVWAVLLAAVLPLIIGRRWRLGWAVQAWALAVVSFMLAWAGGQGWAAGLLPSAEVLLAPAAVAVALAAAMGVTALEVDLPDYNFGWHQLAAVTVAGASVIGVLPIVAASVDGRWGMPKGDFRTIVATLPSPSESFRTLWVGDAGVVPLRGWALDAPSLAEPEAGRQLVYATTVGRSPAVENVWPGSREGATETLSAVLTDAADHGTNRLGAQLAPMGIEYIIVPRRPAPLPFVGQDTSSPGVLIDLLASQLDLRRVDVVAGIHVYLNMAWGPSPAQLPASTTVAAGAEQRTLPELSGAPEVLPDRSADRSASGPVSAGQVYVASGGGDAWSMEVAGRPAPRHDALGWASVFAVDQPGDAHLQVSTPPLERLLRLVQIAVWIGALLVLWRTRARRRRVAPVMDGPADDPGSPGPVDPPAVPVGAEQRS